MHKICIIPFGPTKGSPHEIDGKNNTCLCLPFFLRGVCSVQHAMPFSKFVFLSRNGQAQVVYPLSKRVSFSLSHCLRFFVAGSGVVFRVPITADVVWSFSNAILSSCVLLIIIGCFGILAVDGARQSPTNGIFSVQTSIS